MCSSVKIHITTWVLQHHQGTRSMRTLNRNDQLPWKRNSRHCTQWPYERRHIMCLKEKRSVEVEGPVAAIFVLNRWEKVRYEKKHRMWKGILADCEICVSYATGKIVSGKLYKILMYVIITSAVLSIFVKSLFARADVRSLGIVTHCVDVTIRWNSVGTLIYI